MEPTTTTKFVIGDVCKIVNKPAYDGCIVKIVSLPCTKKQVRTYGVVGKEIVEELAFRASELELIEHAK